MEYNWDWHPRLLVSGLWNDTYIETRSADYITSCEVTYELDKDLTGATVYFVNEIPDGGEIIAQKAVYIEEGDTPEILQRRVMEQAEWILLPQAAEKVCADLQK